MQKDLVEITVKGLMPVNNGVAAFLGPEDKTFILPVDPQTGKAMHYAMRGRSFDRPTTHDLISRIFLGFGVKLERVVINRHAEDTFYARLALRMSNEVESKFVEIDARPSDCIVLALQQKRPIFILRSVLDELEDMTELLERIRQQGAE